MTGCNSSPKRAAMDTVRRCCDVLVRAVAALSIAATLAGCAGPPPRVGEGGESLDSPIWFPDGASVLAYSYMHNRTVLFDVKSGASREVKFKNTYARPAAVSGDGKLIFGKVGATTTAWESGSGSLAWQWIGDSDASIACVTGAELAISIRREVVLLDAANGKVRAVLPSEPYAAAKGAVCSPDRRFLARRYSEGVISIWDIAGRRKLAVLRAWETGGPYPVALGPRAEQLAVWVNERVQLFGRDAWSEPGRDFPPHVARPAAEVDVGLSPGLESPIRRGIAFSPNGRQFAVTGFVKTSMSVFLFRFEQVLVNIEEKRVTRLPSEAGMDFAFSPDGTRLAVVGAGLRIWDIRSGAFVTYPRR